jgi:hypothetical protein
LWHSSSWRHWVGRARRAWLLGRRKNFFADKPTWLGRPSEVGAWLISEFRLGWEDRSQVRAAVVKGKLPQAQRLREPAFLLAERVIEGRFRDFRVPRWTAWPSIVLAAGFAGLAGWAFLSTGRLRIEGGLMIVYALEFAALGTLRGFWWPRRMRRNAAQVARLGTGAGNAAIAWGPE